MTPPTPPQQTRDQQRAKHAMDLVDRVVKALKPDAATKFGGQARKLPMRIVASGLGQALVFLKAKSGKSDGPPPDLLIALGDWVLNKPVAGFNPATTKSTENTLLNAVIEGDADYLRQCTGEALAYLQWLNRFCEAEGLTAEVED